MPDVSASGMNPLPKKVVKLLRQEHVLTLATRSETGVHCANCFYYLWEPELLLVFKSLQDTRHIMEATKHPLVAGTVFYSGKRIHKVKGIQFQGQFIEMKGNLLKGSSSLYYKRFPVGRLINSPFWAIRLKQIKYTETIAGITQKFKWKADKESGN